MHAAVVIILINNKQQKVDKLSHDTGGAQDQQLGVLAGLQDRVSGLSDALTQQAALLRREFKPALQAHEVCVYVCISMCVAQTH